MKHSERKAKNLNNFFLSFHRPALPGLQALLRVPLIDVCGHEIQLQLLKG